MKTLYLDCSMGAAGDMLAAALVQLIEDREQFMARINGALAGMAELELQEDTKCGIRGLHMQVRVNGRQEDEHMHSHEHHHQHMKLEDIYRIIAGLQLPEKIREDVRAVYQLVAQAEGQVHGCTMENVHFHELGSMDALADILAVCWLIYKLSPDKIIASAMNTGSGTVHCAHGILPVPAPATELLLRGIPVYSNGTQSELCTPTGAALIKYFAGDFGPLPAMLVEKTGYGTGKKDFQQANVLRAMLGSSGTDTAQELVELSCNIDDMSPEDLAFAMEQLFELGALDVYFINIGMKKSRPGVMLNCLCRAENRDRLIEGIFKHTSSLGIRERSCRRHSLSRTEQQLDSPYGPIRVKHAQGWGQHRSKPEYEDLAQIARQQGMSLRQLRDYIEKEQ